MAIFTDNKGRPFERPCREDYTSDVEFVRALHEYRDRISAESNRAFDEAFRKAMRP